MEPEEAAWALVEVSLMRDMLPFAPTIRDYVRLTLQQDGYSEDQHPIFSYVFGGKPAPIGEVVERTLHDDQRDNVDNFITENLNSLVYQFNQIPGMESVLTSLLNDKDLDDLAALRPMASVG